MMPAPLTSLAVCGLVLLLFAALRSGAARLGNPAWANPIVIAALLLGSGLIASGVPVAAFEAASAPLRWMLGPAIVALALLVDRARPLLRGRGRAVLLAVLFGSAIGMASALAMAAALGLAPELRAAVAVKSISGPFIYAILRSEDGPVALAAALSVLTGTIGAVCLPPVYRLAGLDAERAARALGLGVSAHLVEDVSFALFPYFIHIYGMKTTMEIPDDLYRRAKTRAAAENRKVRDLVTEGLTVVLERGGAGTEPNETSEQVLNALDEILRSPASPAGRVQELQEEARRIREDGWSRDESLA